MYITFTGGGLVPKIVWRASESSPPIDVNNLVKSSTIDIINGNLITFLPLPIDDSVLTVQQLRLLTLAVEQWIEIKKPEKLYSVRWKL